jgi:hypothetical protein
LKDEKEGKNGLVVWLDVVCEIHLVLIAMATARLDGDPEAKRWVLLAFSDSRQLLHATKPVPSSL